MKNVNVAPQKEAYDAIVVGSGVSGGWAAKELCERGLNTLVLERGRALEHGEGYVTEHVPDWELDYQGRRPPPEVMARDYPKQGRANPFQGPTAHFYIKDPEQPYEEAEDRPFTWVRGDQVGGKSVTWGRQVYRWSDLDFEANARDGHGVDWPIRYRDVAPWYSYVEKFIGVSGQAEQLPQLPDSEFLPPMELTAGEKALKKGIEQAFPERTLTIGRTAVLTQPHNGRGACHYCGPCSRGCSVGAYFSSLSSTLPAAQKTGNLTLRAGAVVHSLVYDPEKGRVTGVRVVDRDTKDVREVRGQVIFLCASTLGSTQILLNSTSNAFPDGLANASGALGRYLMDHHFRLGAQGRMPGLLDRYHMGNRPNGIYIPRFRNLEGPASDGLDFVRGYGYQGGVRRASLQGAGSRAGTGAAFKASLREPGPWSAGIGMWGETLPQASNRVTLSPDETDAYGIPVLHIDCGWGPNELAMRRDAREQAAVMLEAAGAVDVETADNYEEGSLGAEPGLCIHEMGTARMGRDPATSVLNKWNQAHDVPNLFVTDGACMASSACQNPSLTYMALTARAADYAVKQMKRGDLRG